MSNQTAKEQDWTLVWLLKSARDEPGLAPLRVKQALELLYARLGYTEPIPGTEEPQEPVEAVTGPDPYRTEVALSPNRGGAIRPEYIVLHSSYGSFAGTKSWILQSKSKVSYHYLIAADGSRVQFVPSDRRAWHAGSSSWKGRSGLNSCSIGISFWGPTSRDPDEAEIDSCARLCKELMSKYNLSKDAIVTHQMIAPNRKDDCSKKTWQRVLAKI